MQLQTHLHTCRPSGMQQEDGDNDSGIDDSDAEADDDSDSDAEGDADSDVGGDANKKRKTKPGPLVPHCYEVRQSWGLSELGLVLLACTTGRWSCMRTSQTPKLTALAHACTHKHTTSANFYSRARTHTHTHTHMAP